MPKSREQINAEVKAAQRREDDLMRARVKAALGIEAANNHAINAIYVRQLQASADIIRGETALAQRKQGG